MKTATKREIGTMILIVAMMFTVISPSLLKVHADEIHYKQSFSAHMTGPQEVPAVTTPGLGDSVFNVLSAPEDERAIDYQIRTENTAGVTDIVLACAQAGSNGPTVVDLGTNTSGTIYESDLKEDAISCNPNIHTLPQLIQAMREGSIYINVITSGNTGGEIRGQLGNSGSTTLPEPTGDTTGNGGDTTATTTATSTDNGGGNATTTDTISGGGTPTPEILTNTSHSGTRHSGGGGSTSGGQVLGASIGPDSSCSEYLTGYIKFGAHNDVSNVAYLQIFLNSNMNAHLSLNGIYDQATLAAVNQFQLKYSDSILRPWVAFGLPSEKTSTGYVYKTTKYMIDKLACPTSNTPAPILP